MGASSKTDGDLAGHGSAVELLVLVEQSINDRVDPFAGP